MKYLKFLIIALVAFFSFATANAQTVVRERVVVRHHRHGGYYWHKRWYQHREWRHHHWRYY